MDDERRVESNIDLTDKIRHILTTSDYFTNIQWSNVDKTVEFHILQLVDQYKNMNLEQLIEKIDLQRLIPSIIFLLRSEEILFEHNGIYSLIRDPEEAQQEIAAYEGDTDDEELLEIPDEIPDEYFEEEEPSQESQQISTKPELEQSPDEVSFSFDQLTTDEDFNPDSLGFGSNRERLRQQAKETITEDSSEDDLDLDSIFDDALGESIEDAVSEFSDIITESRAKGGTIPLLVDLLKEHGYLKDIEEDSEILKDLAYEILVKIVEQHPITTEEIEAQIEDSISLPMMISNLTSDQIIEQTNDYRWTLSAGTMKRLREFIGIHEDHEVVDDDKLFFEKFITMPDQQLIRATINLAYSVDRGENKESYMEVPEFEILHAIYHNKKLTSNEIKDKVENILPVVVMRMLSRLEADKVITRDSDERWSITNKLRYVMVKHIIEKELDDETLDQFVIKYATY